MVQRMISITGKQKPPIRKNNCPINKILGFTLLEVMIVVIIIAIIVSVSTPRFMNTLTTIRLSNSTQDIAQFMRLLREKAFTEGVNYELKIDFAKRYCYAQKMSGKKGVDFGDKYFIADNINISSSKKNIIFYPDGSIDKVKIFIFKDTGSFGDDINTALGKDLEIGRIQEITRSEYIYSIETQSTIGRVKVTTPEDRDKKS